MEKRSSLPRRPGRAGASLLFFLFLPLSHLGATDLKDLPRYDPAGDGVQVDWLIRTPKRKAQVFRSADGKGLVLSNGLVRRIFRLTPNAATVALDDLVRRRSLLRAVKPEALLWIDGRRYEVGGLEGQPDHAFLKPEWLDRLYAAPGAFQFRGFQVGVPKERFAWKRVRHYDQRCQWPPKGVSLTMDYAMRPLTARQVEDLAGESGFGRKRLALDSFHRLNRKIWRVRVSKTHPRSSFVNEGKVGEIYTPENTAVYVERDLPSGTALVEASFDAGTDQSTDWGPGIVLVWPDRMVRFHLRPGYEEKGGGPFGVYDGEKEDPAVGAGEKTDLSGTWRLRMRIAGGEVACDARPENGRWKTLARIPLHGRAGFPRAVRLGKTDLRGGAADGTPPGRIVRLHVLGFAAYGPLLEKEVDRILAASRRVEGVKVSVHYELYDGVPILCKWVTLENGTDREIRVDKFRCELLAVVENGKGVNARGVPLPRPDLLVETDYAFGSMCYLGSSRWSVHWTPDPEYRTQVNYPRKTPCFLQVGPELGPAQEVPPGGRFESIRSFLVVNDPWDKVRKALAHQRFYRTVAPWITENPLMMHVRRMDWPTVKNAVDQCADVGFELVILSFGSGFSMERENPKYLARMKSYADYAKAKGLDFGGYSLLASRRVGGGNDVVMPPGMRPTFGRSPCLQSEWGRKYFAKLYRFFEKTGFTNLEHDGSYPGDACASTKHPGHKGWADSRWKQWKEISDFYKWCRGRGIYLNVPDYYFLVGSNKVGMGYRETNWSLPRALQVIHTRQNIFDGTWSKTPTMGWMHVPLTQYHGGGQAATIEPLHEHLAHYERMLLSNLAGGVQACYRGIRIYDTDDTRNMLYRWVRWYKRHREVLESDLVHLRRADARDLDGWLHVNPFGKEKGLLALFNPLDEEITRTVTVPLYYTGLTDTALVSRGEEKPKLYKLDRKYNIRLTVTLPAQGFAWYLITAPQ